MDKLRGYVGVLAAIVLLVLAVMPIRGSRNAPWALPITPLDSTVLTRLTVDLTTPKRIWIGATNVLQEQKNCRRENEEFKPYSTWQQRDCTLRSYTWSQVLHVGNGVAELAIQEPALESLLDESLQSELKAARRQEIDSQIATAVNKYLEVQRPKLAQFTWTVHTLIAVIAILMLCGRRLVGAVVLAPFSLLLGAGKATADAARTLHDKV